MLTIRKILTERRAELERVYKAAKTSNDHPGANAELKLAKAFRSIIQVIEDSQSPDLKNEAKIVSKKTWNRFQDSYGAWSILASFLEQNELNQLQALNKKAYQITIKRVQ